MARTNNVNPRLMLDVIASVIKDKYIPADQTKMVEFNTRGKNGSMVCRICVKDEEVLLCAFDERGNNYRHFPYFLQEEGMVCMCDYILFVEDANSLFVFSIDLKDSTSGPRQQTLRSKAFAEFIINRIRVVKGKDRFPKDIQYRQIGIKTTQQKMTTKGFEESYDPEGYLLLPDYHRFYTRWLMNLQVQKSCNR